MQEYDQRVRPEPPGRDRAEQEQNTWTPISQGDLSPIVETLTHLEHLRQRKVLLYMAEDRAPFPKMLDEEDALLFYQGLRDHAPLDRLDLVVNTSGGSVTAVRKLLQVLHTATAHLTILVPYKALSAGTLLCLGAHSIVLTPLAELGPIDPQIERMGTGMQAGMPTRLSSEDIVSFRTMAEQWFGLHGEEHALALLKLLSDRLFPPSLAQFFRAEQLVRQVALEALNFQLPDAGAETRQHVVDQLINGSADHSYPLMRSDLVQLGLQVTAAPLEEERLLWSLWQQGRAYLDTSQNVSAVGRSPSRIDGLFLGTDFRARHLVQMSPLPPTEQEQEMRITRLIQQAHWEILES